MFEKFSTSHDHGGKPCSCVLPEFLDLRHAAAMRKFFGITILVNKKSRFR